MKFFKSALFAGISVFLIFGLLVPSVLEADPPDNSGPHVYRYEENNWFYIWANGMWAFVGLDLVEFCDSGGGFEPSQVQEINSPADIDLLMSHFTGDDVATFIVPEAAIQFNQYGWIDEVYLCDYMATYGEIASGTSDYTGHDNDLRAGVNEHNRTNSFGAKAHGVLFTPSDDPVMFNGGFHCLYAYNPKKDELRFECKDRINLGD